MLRTTRVLFVALMFITCTYPEACAPPTLADAIVDPSSGCCIQSHSDLGKALLQQYNGKVPSCICGCVVANDAECKPPGPLSRDIDKLECGVFLSSANIDLACDSNQ